MRHSSLSGSEQYTDALVHKGQHPWAAHAGEEMMPTLQALLVEAGLTEPAADEVAEHVSRIATDLAWARAGQGLIAIVDRLSASGPMGAGLCRALGLLPGSLQEIAERAGTSKQMIFFYDAKLRAALGKLTVANAGIRRDRQLNASAPHPAKQPARWCPATVPQVGAPRHPERKLPKPFLKMRAVGPISSVRSQLGSTNVSQKPRTRRDAP